MSFKMNELPGHWWAEAGSETQSRWQSLSTEVSSVSPDIGKTCVCRTEAAGRNSPVQGWSRSHRRESPRSGVWGSDAVRRCKWSKASITCQSAGRFILWIINWIYLEKDTQHCQTVRVLEGVAVVAVFGVVVHQVHLTCVTEKGHSLVKEITDQSRAKYDLPLTVCSLPTLSLPPQWKWSCWYTYVSVNPPPVNEGFWLSDKPAGKLRTTRPISCNQLFIEFSCPSANLCVRSPRNWPWWHCCSFWIWTGNTDAMTRWIWPNWSEIDSVRRNQGTEKATHRVLFNETY